MINDPFPKVVDNSDLLELRSSAKTEQISLTADLLNNIDAVKCNEVQSKNFNATHIVVGVVYGGALDLQVIQV